MLQNSLSQGVARAETCPKGDQEKEIRFFTIDAFTVARKHAPTPHLETRMMGIAFIGAVAAHVDRVAAGAPARRSSAGPPPAPRRSSAARARASSRGNMAVIIDGIEATGVDYDAPEAPRDRRAARARAVAHRGAVGVDVPSTTAERTSGLFDPAYYEDRS